MQNYILSEYQCFNVIRFPLIFLGDKIIKPPLFVGMFVLISFVSEKMLNGKVLVANQQAGLISATNSLETLSLMPRLHGSAFDRFRYKKSSWEADEI